MKTRKVVRMPLRRPPPAASARPGKTKLRARAATADEAYDEEEYESYDEPNMKLSHAVFVVLILHVIAVGAIFAFNSIKARQTGELKSASAASAPAAASQPAATTPAEPEVETRPVAATEKTYTVQAGDTLTRIAALNDVSLAALQAENGLDSYSMLRVGQVLKLPAAGKTTATARPAAVESKPKPVAETVEKTTVKATAPATPKATAAPAAATGDVYVVEKGDNPYSIAKKLHISYNELLAANDIKDPTKIQIGQKLKIPAKKN